MVLRSMDPECVELDDFVEAYESAREHGGQVELADFLPPRDHALFLPVLRELVRVELDCGWRAGQPRRIDDYQGRFPDLFEDRQCLEAITFEEYRLRRQLGDRPSKEEYQARWGVNTESWPGQSEPAPIRSSLHEADLLPPTMNLQERSRAALPKPLPVDAVLPAVGTDFLDFHLLAELGRGAFGRVYLVKQHGLAGRYVVLKISSNIALETRLLAQLQHTNIIPVYSVHQAGPLHALCMPYVGSATLADVLKNLRGRQALPHSGKGLVDTAQACTSTTRQEIVSRELASRESGTDSRASEGLEGVPEVAPVAWKQLERLTYVQAVVWLASRLADGLAHAHERGILHRDLKPANILLTDDGQPMLLDFNLSEDVKLRSSASTAFIGGTLPYMAPEHLRTFQQSDATVDARSDVYSLGVILFELLTGRRPFPARVGPVKSILPQMILDRQVTPPRLRPWNKTISPAVESIVRHCLEADPERRYQSARELQEDLQRQMDNRPLGYAHDVSVGERTSKWVRRHPRLATVGVAAASLLFIAGLTTMLILGSVRNAQWEALQSLQAYRDDLQQVRLLFAMSGADDPERLDDGVAIARKALGRYQVASNPAWWKLPSVQRLTAEQQSAVREETGDFLLLLASITAIGTDGSDAKRQAENVQSALELNRLAEACYPKDAAPPFLQLQRANLPRLLNSNARAVELVRQGRFEHPLTTKAICLTAQDFMNRGCYVEARAHWLQAVRQDPTNSWTWAGLAGCNEKLARYADATACYGTCIALNPHLPWLYFKRGVTHLHSKTFTEALADFDQFLKLRPGVPEGYLNRALAYEGLKKDDLAIQDTTKAITLGISQTRAYFIRALLRTRTGDLAGAREDREQGLQREPKDEISCVVRGLNKIGSDPKAAVADFDRALDFNPRSLDGLQNKASVLSEQLRQPTEAVQILTKTIELYPEFVPARAGRGVLLARIGKRDEAIQDAEECLRQDVAASTLYQVAGIYALTSKQRREDKEEAMFLLSSALRKGYGWDLIGIDTDLDPIRELPEFRRLTTKSKSPSKNG